MSKSPYHYRDLLADEQMADEVRALLGMPNLTFESVEAGMFAEIPDPPPPEVQEKLKKKGCVMETNPLYRITISFKHRRHAADYVIITLRSVLYALITICFALVMATARSAYRSEFFRF